MGRNVEHGGPARSRWTEGRGMAYDCRRERGKPRGPAGTGARRGAGPGASSTGKHWGHRGENVPKLQKTKTQKLQST
jgi:hypothetical protein